MMAAQRLSSNARGQQPVLGRAPREHARLFKELSDIQHESSGGVDGSSSGSGSNGGNGDALGVWARLVGEDIQHWEGFLRGPAGTPYEGGCFRVDIQIPRDYPYNPPKMRFTTKIWHPNISSQTVTWYGLCPPYYAAGAICLDILKHEWSPALTIRTALLSIQAMLADPVPTVRTMPVNWKLRTE
ncbi:UNVERIFIED_CONTAM: hypothetical protein H355_004928 [Colinus virginianus]|nr:hypothetical protein H355_004928 [Colinus virginianus]